MLLDVAIPVPLHTTFTYDVPAELASRIQPGMRVKLPFRRGQKMAVVTRLNTQAPAHAKIKPITEILDETPVLSPILLELCQWMSHYYAAPIGELIQQTLPPHLWKEQKRKVQTRLPAPHSSHGLRSTTAPFALTAAQHEAVGQIGRALDPFCFKPFLLHGVTGSGKTEVYLAICHDVLMQERQAIVMVPEIALTPQLLGRFVERFGQAVAVYHSGLTDAQRTLQWQRIRSGEAQIVVGTRSALFAPTPALGVIIVDEEHDSSYKQDESPRYHARDMAVLRAKLENVPVVLGSATPSLESFYNAQQHKYQLLELKERPQGQAMPAVQVVDMRQFKVKGQPLPYFSPPLLAALEKRLQLGEQSLLLVNRRGFAQFLLCEDCGHVYTCPNCDVSLTYHHSAHELRCHYCDYHLPAPDVCATCQSRDVKPIGLGTERLEEALIAAFPQARIGRLDSDTVAVANHRTQLLQDMHDRNLDILVGTQMIAKGHDFSHVTLVGVVSAESSLNFPDFRATERTFQLLMQVSGRAGRAHLPGEVLIQTVQPEHYCLVDVIKHDYHNFAQTELNHRQDLLYPPWGRLINCTIVSNTEKIAHDYAHALSDYLQTISLQHKWTATVYPPAPALLYRLRNKYRLQILIKVATSSVIAALNQGILAHVSQHAPAAVQLQIDVDPMNTM